MPQNSRRGWKRLLTWTLKIAFSGGLIAWVLHKTNLASIGDSLASASPEWLALALAMGIAGTMVQAKQWQRLLLAVDLDRPITRCLRIVFVGNTYNALLPSSIGGDASRAVYIAERQGERAPAAASVALQRLLNFPGMVLLMGFGLDDDQVHSPNEKFEMRCFQKGIRAHIRLLAEIAADSGTMPA